MLAERQEAGREEKVGSRADPTSRDDISDTEAQSSSAMSILISFPGVASRFVALAGDRARLREFRARARCARDLLNSARRAEKRGGISIRRALKLWRFARHLFRHLDRARAESTLYSRLSRMPEWFPSDIRSTSEQSCRELKRCCGTKRERERKRNFTGALAL